ncbi:MAG TPA: putative baseplate assembly protein [Longimicrobium sp.]|nr:putative baseplate assembly protein [Longimicrobium sp.]
MSTGELYFCCDERRRAALRAGAVTGSTLNGIDFLEVDSTGAPGGEQLRLRITFVNAPAAALRSLIVPAAPPYRIAIEGGEQVRGIRVQDAGWDGDVLRVDVDRRGDFSTYTLRIGHADGRPLAGMDELLSAVDFSFKVTCPAPGDCAPDCDCPPEALDEPEIDYLAKDYASFRQLMLDRMALVLPDWRERSPADLGITLVETLAYVGDYLSWQQDAVATEAYLGTARRRASVRRHARLLDYPMHDGCNARAWVQLEVRDGAPAELVLPTGTEVLTRLPERPHVLLPASREREQALAEGPEVFETLHPGRLRAEHNRMPFWTWGQRACCLPRGATRATLAGHYPALRTGDVLVLEEVLGPETGAPPDADAGHRHAVRLTRIEAWVRDEDGAETAVPRTDPVFRHLRALVRLVLDAPDADRHLAMGEVVEVLPPWDGAPAAGGKRTWTIRDSAGREGAVTAEPVVDVELFAPPITVVEWHRDDALPFPLCLSATTDVEHGGRHVSDVSVARGNVVLADHGRTWYDEELGTPPAGNPWLVPAESEGCACGEDDEEAPPGRFRPRLREGPLTQATRVRRPPGTPPDEDVFFDATAGATAAVRSDPARALPVLWVRGENALAPWRARRDLLASGPFARDVVAEVDDEGRAELRFGDDVLGERPEAEIALRATYRVGNGTRGNVGNDALAHVVSAVPGLPGRVLRVRNPLPARGGTEPEAVERVRQVAPSAFRHVAERAVTPPDYARMAERHPQVQRAEATLRWTGSWRTVFLSVDRAGGLPVDAPFEAELRLHLERYRMAGHDLEIGAPRYVPLQVEVFACVEPGYFRGDVERALREVLGSRAYPDGRRGFFHPDRFSFGQGVHLSRIYAAVQGVAGLSRVEVRVFQRQNQPWTSALDSGELVMGRLEVARLDDDPSHRDRGELRLDLKGGR